MEIIVVLTIVEVKNLKAQKDPNVNGVFKLKILLMHVAKYMTIVVVFQILEINNAIRRFYHV